MSPEQELINRYFEGFYAYLAISIIIILLIMIILIFRKKVLSSLKKYNQVSRNIILILILFTVTDLEIYSAVNLVTYAKDYSTVKDREFITITGEVTGYKKEKYDNDGGSYFLLPIIIENDSGNEIILDAFNTSLGETYTFIYLENSKLAVIIED